MTSEYDALSLPELHATLMELQERVIKVRELIKQKTPVVDRFDFEKYSKEYQLMSKYFIGLPLYLQTANLIDYLHTHLLTDEEREQWWKSLPKDPREHLEKLTTMFANDDLLSWWYAHFAPHKNTPENIAAALKHYQFHEDTMFNRLYKKYVDPEWDEKTPLWVTEVDKPKVATKKVTKKAPVAKKATPVVKKATTTSPATKVVKKATPATKKATPVAKKVLPATKKAVPATKKVTPAKKVTKKLEVDMEKLEESHGRAGYKMDEIKEFLRQYKLPLGGTKSELIERLSEHLKE